MRYFIILLLTTCAALQASPEFNAGIAEAQIFESAKGHTLRYTHFKSPKEGAKDHIVFIQGRGTFLEFYEVLVDPLLERSYDVWMYDLTGQGGSARLPLKNANALTQQRMQHIDSFDKYVADAHDFLEHVVLPQVGEGKILLGGYSTGAHIALRYLQMHPENPYEGMFAISPLLSLKIPVPHFVISATLWNTSFLSNLQFYAPYAGDEDPIFYMSYETNPYTSDEESFQNMLRLCSENVDLMMGGVSAGWLKAAADSIGQLWSSKALKAIDIPVLVCTGGEDGVVDVSYNASFVQSLSMGKHLFYPQARHELFRETSSIRADWWQNFDLFFKTP